MAGWWIFSTVGPSELPEYTEDWCAADEELCFYPLPDCTYTQIEGQIRSYYANQHGVACYLWDYAAEKWELIGSIQIPAGSSDWYSFNYSIPNMDTTIHLLFTTTQGADIDVQNGKLHWSSRGEAELVEAITCDRCEGWRNHGPMVTQFDYGDTVHVYLEWGPDTHDFYGETIGFKWYHNGELVGEGTYLITEHLYGVSLCLYWDAPPPTGTGYIEAYHNGNYQGKTNDYSIVELPMGLYERYLPDIENVHTSARLDFCKGQTFTIGNTGPNEDHVVTSVRLRMYRSQEVGTITVAIYATSGGLPVGDPLCLVEYDANNLPLYDPPVPLTEFTFASPATLLPNTQYAIVVVNPNSPTVTLIGSSESPPYTGGTGVYSGTGPGGPWYKYDFDFTFEEYGSPVPEPQPELYERYPAEEGSASMIIFGRYWYAQTFTVGNTGPNEDHIVNSIKLYINRQGLPGTITIAIYAVNGDGKPDILLCSGDYNGDTLPTVADLIEFIFPSPVVLSANTKYAIVMSAPSGDNSNYIAVLFDNSSPSYTGGSCFFSDDSSDSWTEFPNYDFTFEEYGTPVSLPELCTWLADHGAPNILIADVFTIIDSYLFEIPPEEYDFIPTLQNVFGVIDYYLGFDGDEATGCAFPIYEGLKKLSICYKPASWVDWDYLGTHFDMVSCSRSAHNSGILYIKENVNPNLIALGYYDLLLENDYYGDWNFVNTMENWFVHATSGERIYIQQSGYRSYLMNPTLNTTPDEEYTSWPDYYAKKSSDFLTASPHYDGIFADDCTTDIVDGGMCPSFNLHCNQWTMWDPVNENLLNWNKDIPRIQNLMYLLIQNLQNTIPTADVLPNAWKYTEYCQDITHMCVWEHFVHGRVHDYTHNGYGEWYTGYAIETIHAQALLNNIISVISGTQNPETNPAITEEWVKFTMACFLLAVENMDKSYYAFNFWGDAGEDDPHNGYWPIMDYSFGNPVQSWSSNDLADLNIVDSVYVREFENAFVAANISHTQTSTFTINNQQYQLSPRRALFIEKIYPVYEGHDTMIKVGDDLYDPTEENLQTAINSLGGVEGTVWLPRLTPITIQNNRLLVAENCRLRGAYGESVLELLKGIDIQNANNVEISGFKIEGYEGIKIISNTNVSHFVLENIEAYDLNQTSAAPAGLFRIWAQDCTISDITMRNLHAERINCMMVHLSGGGTTDKIKDILIEDCYGKTCGYGIGRDWTTCYDLAEGITYLENMLVRRCHAEDGWENGFHWENLPTKTNVVIEDCTGMNNGWRKPDASFGSGIWVSGGVTVRNCTSGGNKVRGYTFNNNKAGAETNIIDCMDDGSTVGIKGEGTGGNTYITNFETKNNLDYGFYIILAKNIHISNMRVDNSGGAASYNNLFGSASYPVTDSELDVIIVNDPVNAYTILTRNGVNLHFTGSIKTHSERGLYISTGTNILVEMHVDSTGNSGIHGYGTLTDVYVKNSLIENTEGTPDLEYGIFNGGTQIFVEEATVTVRDALVDYYNCTFV